MHDVSKYRIEQQDKWNSFLKSSKNATFLFDRNFMDYHSDQFNDYSLIVTDKSSGNIVALLPANITDNNIVVSHEGLTYGGLILHKEEKLNRTLICFRDICKYLSAQGINKIIYKQIPSIYNDIPSDEQEYALFILGANLIRRDTSIAVSYKCDIQYQTRRERGIKKAIKKGVTIKEVDHFDEFWNNILIPGLNARYDVDPTHSLEEIQLLGRRFPQQIRQFNAYLGDQIVAGTTIFETLEVAHAQYIAASLEGMEIGANDFLFDQLIQNIFEHKSYFNLGICNENEGKTLNHGLLNWKEGFGGRTISHNFYEIVTSNYSKLDKVINDFHK